MIRKIDNSKLNLYSSDFSLVFLIKLFRAVRCWRWQCLLTELFLCCEINTIQFFHQSLSNVTSVKVILSKILFSCSAFYCCHFFLFFTTKLLLLIFQICGAFLNQDVLNVFEDDNQKIFLVDHYGRRKSDDDL